MSTLIDLVSGHTSTVVIVALALVVLFLLKVISEAARSLAATASSALSGAIRLMGAMFVAIAVLAMVVFVLVR